MKPKKAQRKENRTRGNLILGCLAMEAGLGAISKVTKRRKRKLLLNGRLESANLHGEKSRVKKRQNVPNINIGARRKVDVLLEPPAERSCSAKWGIKRRNKRGALHSLMYCVIERKKREKED